MGNDKSQKIAYFGYGSLVNLLTLRTPYISAHRARIKGWERVWLTRPPSANDFSSKHELAFLSVRPCEHSFLDGLIIVDHRASLPKLDEREALYERRMVPPDQLEILDGDGTPENVETFIYVSTYPAAQKGSGILRSYLDAVMQGYLTHFGEKGLERFIDTTYGFQCGLIEDRESPIYPRAVTLSAKERTLFDQLI